MPLVGHTSPVPNRASEQPLLKTHVREEKPPPRSRQEATEMAGQSCGPVEEPATDSSSARGQEAQEVASEHA